MDIDALSDVELRQLLIANGINCGPIAPTTRSVYVKKLKGVLANAESSEPPQLDIALERAVTPPVVTPQLTPTRTRSTPQATPQMIRHASPVIAPVETNENGDLSGNESDCDYCGEESFRVVNTEQQLTSSTGRPGKMILLVTLAIVGAVFVFFLSDHVNRLTGGNNEEL